MRKWRIYLRWRGVRRRVLLFRHTSLSRSPGSRVRLLSTLCWKLYVFMRNSLIFETSNHDYYFFLSAAAEMCGGPWRLGVYKANSELTKPAWTSYGCVAEGTTGSRRALTGPSYGQSGMTPQICQEHCESFKYAGVEYG